METGSPAAATRPTPLRLHLRAGTTVAVLPDGTRELSRRLQRLTLEGMSEGRIRALEALATVGVTETEAAAMVGEDAILDLAAWYWTIRQLQELHMLEFVLSGVDGRVAGLVPASQHFGVSPLALEPSRPFRLSSYARVQRVDALLVASSPLAPAHVELSEAAARVLVEWTAPRTPAEWVALSAFPPSDAQALLVLLHAARILSPVGKDGECEDDRRARELGWSPADAAYHFHARIGRSPDHFHGARPDEQRDPRPSPPGPRPRESEFVPFPDPDGEGMEASDPPFQEVLERRRSVRSYGERPVSLGQIASFLGRSARVRGPRPEDPAAPYRPHPSGGGCYPLEIYLAVERCEGLEPGVYRYDPFLHGVGRIDASPGALQRALDASRLRGVDEFQVLLLITARLGRLSWKYDTISYSIVLKDVGALMQTMYLVATAMGLAPCAIGIGDSHSLPRALGLDPLEETTVGEFALGALPED